MGWRDTEQDDEIQVAAETPAPEAPTTNSWRDTVADEEPAPDAEPVMAAPGVVPEPGGFYASGRYRVKDPLSPSEWVKSIKHEFTKPLDPSAAAAVNGPLGYLAGQVAGNAATAKALGAVSGTVKTGMEKFATSPLPKKISDATNVVAKGKGFASKIFDSIGDEMGPQAKKVMDFIGSVGGRKAAYSNPISGVPQAVSDASKVVQGAQKGAAWLLDNAPDKLGKFASVLSKAKAQGGTALATTEFLLSQKDPEYQEVMKLQREGR